MARPPEEWMYNYETLARLTDQTADTVRKHRERGKYDPRKLDTVLVYIARFGTPELRQAILDYALARQVAEQQPIKRKK